MGQLQEEVVLRAEPAENGAAAAWEEKLHHSGKTFLHVSKTCANKEDGPTAEDTDFTEKEKAEHTEILLGFAIAPFRTMGYFEPQNYVSAAAGFEQHESTSAY